MASKDSPSGHLIWFPARLSWWEQGPPGIDEDMPDDETDLAVATHLAHLRMRGQTPDTVYCRRRALARMQAALGKPVLDATPADLLAWRAALTIGPGATVSYVSHAREFYRWAVRSGLLESSPAEGLPVPRLRRRLPRPISEDRLMAAVTSAPERIRPWLVLAGWAGLRAREIAYLRRECVLDAQEPPKLLVEQGAAKGGTERIVPLSGYVLAELRAAGLPRAGWVFRRRDGQDGPNRPWTISHLANTYLHELGIPATLHQLRHRFGTMTYRGKRDLRLVQELLGHADPGTTAGYAAYDKGDAVDVVEQLPTPRHLRAVDGIISAH